MNNKNFIPKEAGTISDFKQFVNFTAIDFETANAAPNSICQVGLVRVENGEIVDSINELVLPPGNEYNFYNIKVHGIKPAMTASADTFDIVWQKFSKYIIDQNVVAHNVKFDSGCLNKTLAFYGIEKPNYKTHCTVKIYKRNLAFLCDKYGIELNHHDAYSDALACAKLFMKYLIETADGTFTLK